MSTNRKPFESYEWGEQLAAVAETYLTLFDSESTEWLVNQIEWERARKQTRRWTLA